MTISELLNKLNLVTPRLIARKPLFLLRALFLGVRTQVLKRPPEMRSVLFHTHYLCNLSCSHCYETKFDNTVKPPLTLEEKKRVLRECVSAGTIAIDFVSGETSLDRNLAELVKASSPHKTYITLCTHGFKLKEEQII